MTFLSWTACGLLGILLGIYFVFHEFPYGATVFSFELMGLMPLVLGGLAEWARRYVKSPTMIYISPVSLVLLATASWRLNLAMIGL